MDFELIKASTVGFVQHNQSWAPFVVAGLAFGESIAILSLFVPATVILIAIGALIGVAAWSFGRSGSARQSAQLLEIPSPTGLADGSSGRPWKPGP